MLWRQQLVVDHHPAADLLQLLWQRQQLERLREQQLRLLLKTRAPRKGRLFILYDKVDFPCRGGPCALLRFCDTKPQKGASRAPPPTMRTPRDYCARVAPTGKSEDFRASAWEKHICTFWWIFVDGFPGLVKLESKKISKN